MPEGVHYKDDISLAILKLKESGKLQEFENRYHTPINHDLPNIACHVLYHRSITHNTTPSLGLNGISCKWPFVEM